MARYINSVPAIYDGNGKPIVGAKKYFFETGTTTLKTVYSDSGLTTPISNPVLSDSDGRFPSIFLDGIYKERQDDENDVTLWTRDPVGDIVEGQFELWLNDNNYNVPEIVRGSDDSYYQSIVDGNQGNDPTTSPTKWKELRLGQNWNTNVTYSANDSVYGSDGNIYISKTSSNTGNNPTTDTTNWRNGTTNTISPDYLINVGYTATIAAKALTFDIKGQDLSDPSSSNVVSIPFRSETLTTGDFDIVNVSTALTLVVPSGATLGFAAVATDFIYLYAMNVSGAVELAVSGSFLDDAVLHSSSAIDATSDLRTSLYSTTGRSNIPIRMIGRIKITTGAVAGEWDNAPTELFVGKTNVNTQQLVKAWVNFNGTGTVAIRDSYNVSSITDLGVGNYQINFTNPMNSANYAVSGSTGIAGSIRNGTITTTNAQIVSVDNAGINTDSGQIHAQIIGD